MRFVMKEPVPRIARGEVKVGDVFKAKATGPFGRRGTRYWLVAAITHSVPNCGTVHHLLGLNAEGVIVSTNSYGSHVMEERTLVGRCEDFSALSLNIIWNENHADCS